MNKPLPSEMNSAERISFCKDGLIDCKKNQRRILWIGLASIIGVWLTSQCFIDNFIVSYCLFFGVGTPILWIYINLRRVYSSLSEVYEAELDAVKDNE
jgi:hypothetical protein